VVAHDFNGVILSCEGLIEEEKVLPEEEFDLLEEVLPDFHLFDVVDLEKNLVDGFLG
jgi:hypothetical protein